MNDTERAQWIANDEGLYNWQRRSGLSVRQFIRKNRAEIDAAINPVLDGTKPAHHLAYQHGHDCVCAGCKRRALLRGRQWGFP